MLFPRHAPTSVHSEGDKYAVQSHQSSSKCCTAIQPKGATAIIVAVTDQQGNTWNTMPLKYSTSMH